MSRLAVATVERGEERRCCAGWGYDTSPQNGSCTATLVAGQFFDPNIGANGAAIIPQAVVTLSHDDQIKLFAQTIGDVGTQELKQDVLIMATGAADVAALRGLALLGKEAATAGAFGPSTVGAAQAPLTRELMKETGMTAGEAIGKYKLGSINRVFPGQFLNATLEQIENAARAGDRAARTALKLLFDSRFNKP